MASFDGATFGEKGDGAFFPHPGGKVPYDLVTLAGGGQAYRTSGQVERAATVTARCTADELTALRGKAGTVGTLILGAGSYADCLLDEVGKPKEILVSRRYEVELAFTLGISETQRISVGVNIAGAATHGVVGLTTSCGKSQGVSTAAVHYLAAPSGSPGDLVEIFASINGGTATAIYKGRYDRLSWDYYPGLVTLECKGKLALLSMPWGSEVERVYCEEKSNSDDAVIIRNLIEAWGYSSGDHNIDSTSWTLGTIQEVVVKKGDVFADWIRRIDEVADCETYDLNNGAIFRRLKQRAGAGGESAATFTEGVNILSISRKRGGPDTIVNQAVVEGLTYEGVEVKQDASATSAILDAWAPGTAPNYRAVTLKSDLIEDDTKALAVATRKVSEGNRVDDGLEVTVPLCLDIQAGVSVTVNAPSVGASSAFLIVDVVKHSIEGEKGITTFTTNAGTLS